jgi:hypothetical protein
MDLELARSSLDAERTRVQQLLANLGLDRTDDHDAERDASYLAQPLAQQGSISWPDIADRLPRPAPDPGKVPADGRHPIRTNENPTLRSGLRKSV